MTDLPSRPNNQAQLADLGTHFPARAVGNDMTNAVRKGPHRLDKILQTDRLALIVTNRRARAGMKPQRISRIED